MPPILLFARSRQQPSESEPVKHECAVNVASTDSDVLPAATLPPSSAKPVKRNLGHAFFVTDIDFARSRQQPWESEQVHHELAVDDAFTDSDVLPAATLPPLSAKPVNRNHGHAFMVSNIDSDNARVSIVLGHGRDKPYPAAQEE